MSGAIDGSPGLRQLTARDLVDIDVRECWGGPATVRIEPNAQAPMHRLPVVEMLDGWYWLGDFSLVGGVILHDYHARGGDGGRPDD
jgi:acetoacetate decarboxylase